MLPPESLEYQFRKETKREWPASVEHLMFCARLAAEQGADIVKTFYTGDPRSFARVVESTPIPVLVLSGPWANDTRQLFSFVRDAIDAGAAGVSMGRNIWQHDHPAAVTRALAGVIHQGWNAAQAMEFLQAELAGSRTR
jgi:class I fructose-bisphosphate aldolase